MPMVHNRRGTNGYKVKGTSWRVAVPDSQCDPCRGVIAKLVGAPSQAVLAAASQPPSAVTLDSTHETQRPPQPQHPP